MSGPANKTALEITETFIAAFLKAANSGHIETAAEIFNAHVIHLQKNLNVAAVAAQTALHNLAFRAFRPTAEIAVSANEMQAQLLDGTTRPGVTAALHMAAGQLGLTFPPHPIPAPAR